MADRKKFTELYFEVGSFPRFSLLQTFDTPRPEAQPAQNLSSGFLHWIDKHILALITILANCFTRQDASTLPPVPVRGKWFVSCLHQNLSHPQTSTKRPLDRLQVTIQKSMVLCCSRPRNSKANWMLVAPRRTVPYCQQYNPDKSEQNINK